jgi:hypothetical protein
MSGSGQGYPKSIGARMPTLRLSTSVWRNTALNPFLRNAYRMFTTAQIQPIDQEIIDAVREIHVEQPKLGRGKLCVYTGFALRPKCILTLYPISRLAQLKDAHNWSLSDTRLKKLLAENNLKRQAEVPKTLPPIELPANAFAAQETYKKDGIRCFKLYGRGECDYGVTPNADMALLFNAS